MEVRRTSDPDICYMPANSVLRFGYDIKEFRVDTRHRKFILTPIGWDGCERGPPCDVTECWERFQRERR
jgi:hypothetical protein